MLGMSYQREIDTDYTKPSGDAQIFLAIVFTITELWTTKCTKDDVESVENLM